MHIGLIRHGQSQWNVDGRWQGHAHVPLNDEGRIQAQLLATYLSEDAHFSKTTGIITSDQPRAYQTAEILAQRLNAPVVRDPRLREIDMGDWQGLTWDEIRTWDKERYERITADPFNLPRPNGENLNQVADRAVAAMHEFVDLNPETNFLIVTHGGTIRTILHRLNLLSDRWHGVGNTSLTRLLYTASSEHWALLGLNELDHLAARDTDGRKAET